MSARSLQESIRLDALDRYDLLDTPGEAAFDRITRIAAQLIGTPMALISLVDQDRQWFKSHHGLSAQETPRSVSFCAHAIAETSPFLVPDARTDPRFADNALVTGEMQLRFYLGVPLRMHDGQALGTLCALDRVPRDPSIEQIAALADLARLVVDEMELRQIATIDSLTGALTRRALEQRVNAEIERSHRYGNLLSFALLDIDHFKAVNDAHGHAGGDVVLQMVVSALRATLRQVDIIGRMGGEEFLIVMPETSLASAMHTVERLRRTIERLCMPFGEQTLRATASFGVTALAARDHQLATVLARADQAMYAAKAQGRNRVVMTPPQ
jgi:diguanylate cyclase (GGDEF)-like protein